MIPSIGILLHGFGQRYDLPISRYLYFVAAGFVVVISFVLVVVFAGEKIGEKAVQYPRRAVPWLTSLGRSPWPPAIGGVIGVLALAAVIVSGFLGSQKHPELNPAEYIVWIYFWAATVILSGLIGNLWYLLNPWAAIYDAASRFVPLRPAYHLPAIGVWPAVALYFSFACLELTSGMSNRPWIVALAALSYTCLTLAGMVLYGRDAWLEQCEAFTVLFRIVGRFGPVESERDESGRISAVYIRPWGVGLLKDPPVGWDRVVFVILMLSTLAFDGVIATPAWQDFDIALEPIWLPLGASGFFFIRTLGLVLLTVAFLLVFIAVMQAVLYFGSRKVDRKATVSAFALTLVPIALVYNAAHNYSYVMVQSQGIVPVLNDPLGLGWHLFPSVAGYTPSFALAQASTVWYAQVILIVLGHIIAVYLSHLRAGERFRTMQRALLSQYPMLILMVAYTWISLTILAAPTTTGG
ncbi:MAG: hypothetical protein E6I34_05275 [Chloroflexi bacterium]|nr:MAG: hypothetical protein E6I34_05275 [Chloroflexota bacterium]